MLSLRTVRGGSLVALFGALVTSMGTGCAAAPASLEDGAGSVTQNTSAGRATAPVANDAGTAAAPLDCTTADEGCACDQEGETALCAGPKIHTGNYTTCAPGTRTCSNGVWGACLGTPIASESSTLTQDYSLDCDDDQAMNWGAIDLQGSTPVGANIDVFVQTAASESRLTAAPMVHVTQFNGTSHSSWTSPEVDAVLTAAGVAPAQWLRVTLALTGSQIASAPTVKTWRQASSCTSK